MANVVKKRVKGVGMRCVHTSGKKKGKFAKNSACGLKKKATKKRSKRRKR